jgi:hypothetical protein
MITGKADGLSSNEHFVAAWNQGDYQKAVGLLLQMKSNDQ